ncbi:MAG TPA: glycosyltransferase [Candidatus Saccharimonadales bacterium]|nr:glycosyltransferase [Candidatus Saccharimonadales bacterium]
MPKESVLDMSVIVPFKDHSDLTIPCLDSLHKYADPVKEIILISNNSSKEELAKVTAAAKRYKNTKVLVYDHPFNFHKINNFGARHATGKVLFMLNNDIELIAQTGSLLTAMYHKALQKDVGGVGCVLVFEDGVTVQHAGVYLIPGGTADHLYTGKKLADVVRNIKSGEYKYDTTKDLNMGAVTAAAVMIEKRKFDEINGFNEDFIICGGDVDICFRLQEKGYENWLVGSDAGYMIHKESRSRSLLAIPYQDFVESHRIYVRHFDTKVGDPYLHWQEIPR